MIKKILLFLRKKSILLAYKEKIGISFMKTEENLKQTISPTIELKENPEWVRVLCELLEACKRERMREVGD